MGQQTEVNRHNCSAKKIIEGDSRRFHVGLLESEKGIQKQYENSKIREAEYNKRYEVIEEKGRGPKYLRKEYLIKKKNRR